MKRGLAWFLWVLSFLLLTGCHHIPLYTPEVDVVPRTVGLAGRFTVNLYGSKIVAYAFLGAVNRMNGEGDGDLGEWQVHLLPQAFGRPAATSTFTVHEGEVIPLGPNPSVLVRFNRITPTQLQLDPVGVFSAREIRHHRSLEKKSGTGIKFGVLLK